MDSIERAFVADMVDTQTGERILWPWVARSDDGYVSTFTWSDGNYSCDCNRALIFARTRGEEYPKTVPPCGTGRYRVRILDCVTQEEVYTEFPTAVQEQE